MEKEDKVTRAQEVASDCQKLKGQDFVVMFRLIGKGKLVHFRMLQRLEDSHL